jgi:uncharacterized protein (DUF3084 family)
VPVLRNPFTPSCAWNAASIAQLNTTLAGVRSTLASLQTTLKNVSSQIGALIVTANSLDTSITALQAAVTAEETEEQSAIVLLNGIPQLIASAVAQAQAAGATPAELSSLTDLQTAITQNTAGLAAAVVANTPATSAPAATS